MEYLLMNANIISNMPLNAMGADVADVADVNYKGLNDLLESVFCLLTF